MNHGYQYLFDRPDSVFVPHAIDAPTGTMAPPSANVKFSTRPTLVPVSLPPAALYPSNRVAASQLPAAPSVGQSSSSVSGLPTLMYSEVERGLPASALVALAPSGLSPQNPIIPTAQSGPDLEMSWEDWEALEDDDKGAPPPRGTMDATPIALDLPTQSKPELQDPSVQEATSSAAPPEIEEQSIARVIEVTPQGPKVELPIVKEGGKTSTVLDAGHQVASTNSPDNTESHIPSTEVPVVTERDARDSSNIQTTVSDGASLNDVGTPVGEDGATFPYHFCCSCFLEGMELDVSEPAISLETQNKDLAADPTMVAPEGVGVDPSEAFVMASPPSQTDDSSINRLSSPQARKEGMEIHEDAEISTILDPNLSVARPEVAGEEPGVAGEEPEDAPIPEGEIRNSNLAPQIGTPQLDKVCSRLMT